MSHLDIFLLGTPLVYLNSQQIDKFNARKDQALLYYLASAGQPHSRAELSALLWSELPEEKARRNLRNALSNLRKVIGVDWLETGEGVGLTKTLPWELDVRTFGSAIAQPEKSWQVDEFSRIMELYRGEFLQGFHVQKAPAFEEWVRERREEYRLLALHGMAALVQQCMIQKELALGLSATQRYLQLEPWSEEMHRARMWLLAACDQRGAALNQYETCRRVLADEFGVLPESTTMGLYRQIKAGESDIEPPPLMISRTNLLNQFHTSEASNLTHSSARSIDWGDAPDTGDFYGREEEQAALKQWLIDPSCQLISVLGIGGMGKTTLASKVAHAVAEQFELVLWRSILNSPPLSELLYVAHGLLAPDSVTELPKSQDEQINLLFNQLRQRRCLLILDNIESIISLERPGEFKLGYEAYGQFLRRFMASDHQSCLLLTSRETPNAIRAIPKESVTVRTLHLGGLQHPAAQELIESLTSHSDGLLSVDKPMSAELAAAPDYAELVQRYSGNPLALKLVATTIRDFFDGDIGIFQRDEPLIFDDIRDLLEQQFARLSREEEVLLFWLAVEREPVSFTELTANLVHMNSTRVWLEAIRTLEGRSIIENDQGQLRLQNVVLEYATDLLVNNISSELKSWIEMGHEWEELVLPTSSTKANVNTFALMKARAKDYVRLAQERMLLEPVVQNLKGDWDVGTLERKLKELLAILQAQPWRKVGYTAANLLHMLHYLDVDLQNADFSDLAVWQADLRNVQAASINFAQADLSGASFIESCDPITDAILSPDGKILISASMDGYIYMWETSTLQFLETLDGGQGSITALALSSDGRMLASAGHSSILLWMSDSHYKWQPWYSITIPAECNVSGLAISSDNQYLAAVPVADSLSVWKIPSGQKHFQAAIQEGKKNTHALNFSPDGGILACTNGRQVMLWNVHDQSCVDTLDGHNHDVSCVTFSSDGSYLISTSPDGTVRFWNTDDYSEADILSGFKQWQNVVSLGSKGEVLAVNDGPFIQLWEKVASTLNGDNATLNFELQHVLVGHTTSIRSLLFSPSDQALFSASMETMRKWDVATGSALHILVGHQNALLEVAMHPTKQLLVTGDINGKVQLWKVDENTVHRTIVLAQCAEAIRTITFTGDGEYVVAYTSDEVLYRWHLSSATEQLSWRDPDFAVTYPALSLDGQYLATICEDQHVRVRDAKSGDLLYVLGGYAKRLDRIIFNVDGRMLAGLDAMNQIHIWDLGVDELSVDNASVADMGTVSVKKDKSGKKGHAPPLPEHRRRQPQAALLSPTQIEGYTNGGVAPPAITPLLVLEELSDDKIEALKFGPDDTLVFGMNGSVTIIDLITRKPRYVLDGDNAYLLDLEVSQNGILAVSGYEKVIRLYETETGKPLGKLWGHQDGIYDVAFNSTGDRLYSVSLDGEMRVWDVPNQACLAIIEAELPYAGMNIRGATGISDARRSSLLKLGAVEKGDSVNLAMPNEDALSESLPDDD